MDKYSELYQKIIVERIDASIRFDDLRYFIECGGFEVRAIRGDHFTYRMDGVQEIINIQPSKGDSKMAKDYQVKQVRKIFQRYKIGDER